MKNIMNINEKCQKLPILRTQHVEFIDGECVYENKSVISEWIKAFYHLDLISDDYMRKYNTLMMKIGAEEGVSIEEREISLFTRDEILTIISFMLRSDHFGNHNIAYALNNGFLEKMCVQLHKVTSEPEN